ncbi:MAG: hypothetical protein LBK18_07165 [Prevotellaceae bacterium]|jgi:hypothetical protein|nr:hypothetical protein [Prevotellaceae bacterium]
MAQKNSSHKDKTIFNIREAFMYAKFATFAPAKRLKKGRAIFFRFNPEFRCVHVLLIEVSTLAKSNNNKGL